MVLRNSKSARVIHHRQHPQRQIEVFFPPLNDLRQLLEEMVRRSEHVQRHAEVHILFKIKRAEQPSRICHLKEALLMHAASFCDVIG